MSCHLRSFSGEIWLNCSLTSATSFAFCSAVRRNVAPETMLRLTAVPTRKRSLNASLSVSAAFVVTPMVRSVASTTVVRVIGVLMDLLRHEFEDFTALVHHGVDAVRQDIELAILIFAQRPDVGLDSSIWVILQRERL